MLNSKKAAIGKTITWIVATLVIVGILIFFVIVSIATSKLKNLNVIVSSNPQSDLKEESQILTIKTSLAHELNNSNQEIIDDLLKPK